MGDSQRVIDITIAPGEFWFGGGNKRIHTLLGSCVAITLWHPVKRIGGMCHYVLPVRNDNQRLSPGHYADEAVQLFLGEVKKARTSPPQYEVKMFGGGKMFDFLGINVPKGNIESGTRLLRSHGFTVKATDLGGAYHRKIYLELPTGDVWVQRGRPR